MKTSLTIRTIIVLIIAFTLSHNISYSQYDTVYYSGSDIIYIDSDNPANTQNPLINQILVTVEVLGVATNCYDWYFQYGFIIRVTSTSLFNLPYSFQYNVYVQSNPGDVGAYAGAFTLSNTSEENIYTLHNNAYDGGCPGASSTSDWADCCNNFSVWDAHPFSFSIDYWDGYDPTSSIENEFVTHLSIPLLNFSVYNETNVNVVSWAVDQTNETEISHYIIAHSDDGINWKYLDNINKNMNHGYVYPHRNYTMNSYNYYRLHSADYNGTTELVKIGVIKNSHGDSEHKLYNSLGQEVNEHQKGLILKKYNDGKVEKTYK